MSRGSTTRFAAAVVLAAVLAGCSTVPPPDDDPTLTEAPVAEDTAPVSVPADAPGPAAAPVVAEAAAPPPPPAPSATRTATTPDAPTAADPAGFVWVVDTVTAADVPSSWREGCPVGPESLRAVTLSYVDFDGVDRTGVLVVNADIVSATRRAFASLFAQRFPISSIRPVDEFGGDDDASMAANNTSGFNCRYAVSNAATPSWSNHAYGRAIDINTVQNPYILGGDVLPPNGAPYTDRSGAPGMFTRGSDAVNAFTSNGFEWGGTWRNPDYQHMER